MLYTRHEFPRASFLGMFAVNVDLVCDLIPVVSTVTNLARVVFKTGCYALWLSASSLIGAFMLVKASIIFIIPYKDKNARYYQNFSSAMKSIFLIQSLWTKTFFSFHYLGKGMGKTLLHAIPIIGNIFAYIFAETKTYSRQSKAWEDVLKSWQITPQYNQNRPLFSYYYPEAIPAHMSFDRALTIANCKLNPYLIKKIPPSFFADVDFVKNLLRVMSYHHHGRSSYMPRSDFDDLMRYIILEAQKFGNLEDVSLPLENYLFHHDFGEFLDLLKLYPDLLWLIDDLKFFEHKKYVSTIIKDCPHVVTILSEHFLKLNKSMVTQALTQDPFIASKLSLAILVFAFSSKDDVLKDGVFLSCCKHHGLLYSTMSKHLKRKTEVRRLKLA